jgi:hypothetical protein
MRQNPRGDWTIKDVETVCSSIRGAIFKKPTGGSHYKIAGEGLVEILTIPARRRIKPIYVRRFVSMMDSIIAKKGE